MKWSKDKLTKPGYYWYKDYVDLEPEIVYVEKSKSIYNHSGFKVSFFNKNNAYDVYYKKGYWLGPIQPETES